MFIFCRFSEGHYDVMFPLFPRKPGGNIEDAAYIPRQEISLKFHLKTIIPPISVEFTWIE